MKTCGNCAWKSDGFQSEPDYCYILDNHIDPDNLPCDEWRGSLRDEPINKAPLLTPEELLARRVSEMDGGEH